MKKQFLLVLAVAIAIATLNSCGTMAKARAEATAQTANAGSTAQSSTKQSEKSEDNSDLVANVKKAKEEAAQKEKEAKEAKKKSDRATKDFLDEQKQADLANQKKLSRERADFKETQQNERAEAGIDKSLASDAVSKRKTKKDSCENYRRAFDAGMKCAQKKFKLKEQSCFREYNNECYQQKPCGGYYEGFCNYNPYQFQQMGYGCQQQYSYGPSWFDFFLPTWNHVSPNWFMQNNGNQYPYGYDPYGILPGNSYVTVPNLGYGQYQITTSNNTGSGDPYYYKSLDVPASNNGAKNIEVVSGVKTPEPVSSKTAVAEVSNMDLYNPYNPNNRISELTSSGSTQRTEQPRPAAQQATGWGEIDSRGNAMNMESQFNAKPADAFVSRTNGNSNTATSSRNEKPLVQANNSARNEKPVNANAFASRNEKPAEHVNEKPRPGATHLPAVHTGGATHSSSPMLGGGSRSNASGKR